jgi:hypothetical protein
VGACLLAGMVQADTGSTGTTPAAAGTPAAAPAQGPQIKAGAPDRYTVVKGDTLWGIAERYLNDPWRWPEIWQANQQVYNPHLIYPGDVLLLCHIKGQAVVAVDQGGGCAEVESRIASGNPAPPTQTELSDGTVKLHPQIREMPLSIAIPAIPLKDIQRYLNDSRVVTKEELDRAPYVIGGESSQLVTGAGDKVYVRNNNKLLVANSSYGVYRGGVRYLDPDTGEVLGYEAEDIGSGKLVGLEPEVGTLELTRTTQDVRIGDKLLPNETGRISAIFHPANPDGVKPGSVIRIFDTISSAAQFGVIVLNRGEADGVKPGHVFALYHNGGVLRDIIAEQAVALPAEHEGLAMVFRTFPRVSYALILRSTRPIRVGDKARPPVDGD